MARTHYDVLGTSMRATPEELRQAYRDRARVLHPDRQLARDGRETDALGAAMRELNEAWRVLRDPAGRAAYDRSLVPPSFVPRSGAYAGFDDPADLDDDMLDRPFRGRPAEPGDLVVALARVLPWLVIGAVLGGIFVFTAFAASRGDPPAGPAVFECVRSTSAIDKVPCAAGAEQIRDITQQVSECPDGTSGVEVGRSRVLCLQPFAGASP
jgi:hypothetical protein